jgi:hypothetical protein
MTNEIEKKPAAQEPRQNREPTEPGKPQTGFLKANPEFEFAWHTLKKVFVFVVIALAAAGIHLVVEELEHRKFEAGITITLRVVAYIVLVVDVIWFLRALLTEMLVLLTDLLLGKLWLRILTALTLIVLGAALSSPLKTALFSFLHWIAEAVT